MKNSISSSGGSYACNCMYGPQDPRCCIARAQRKLLEDAWEMGRRGEPLPPVQQRYNLSTISAGILSVNEIKEREGRDAP